MACFDLEIKNKIWLLGFSVAAQAHEHQRCTRGQLRHNTPCWLQNRCDCRYPRPSWWLSGRHTCQNRYFSAFFSPIELAFETTTPPKAALFSPNGCSKCQFSTCRILAALSRLSLANVGHVAKLGQIGGFCLGNQKQNLASWV